MPQADADSPVVSFASDLDGDLHMFSSDPDVDVWTVIIGTADGADDAPASGQFWGYYTLAEPAFPAIASSSGSTDTSPSQQTSSPRPQPGTGMRY